MPKKYAVGKFITQINATRYYVKAYAGKQNFIQVIARDVITKKPSLLPAKFFGYEDAATYLSYYIPVVS